MTRCSKFAEFTFRLKSEHEREAAHREALPQKTKDVKKGLQALSHRLGALYREKGEPEARERHEPAIEEAFEDLKRVLGEREE